MQHALCQFFLLLFEIGGVGLLFLGHPVNQPILAKVKGNTHAAGLQIESRAKLLATRGSRNGTIASQQITGLGLESEGFGRRVKFLTGLCPFDKFFGFVAGERGCFFA